MADTDQEAYEKWARAIDKREGVVRPPGYEYKMPSHMRGSVHRGRLNPLTKDTPEPMGREGFNTDKEYKKYRAAIQRSPASLKPGTIKKAFDFIDKVSVGS